MDYGLELPIIVVICTQLHSKVLHYENEENRHKENIF